MIDINYYAKMFVAVIFLVVLIVSLWAIAPFMDTVINELVLGLPATDPLGMVIARLLFPIMIVLFILVVLFVQPKRRKDEFEF